MTVGMVLLWGLAERFARGEIDDQEYRTRLATLQAGAPPADGS
jgi:uncharacterized membrane protein